eukprot:2376565-Alexandrium_andersonii.AAC.1
MSCATLPVWGTRLEGRKNFTPNGSSGRGQLVGPTPIPRRPESRSAKRAQPTDHQAGCVEQVA